VAGSRKGNGDECRTRGTSYDKGSFGPLPLMVHGALRSLGRWVVRVANRLLFVEPTGQVSREIPTREFTPLACFIPANSSSGSQRSLMLNIEICISNLNYMS
jgi:hypothetical protein